MWGGVSVGGGVSVCVRGRKGAEKGGVSSVELDSGGEGGHPV